MATLLALMSMTSTSCAKPEPVVKEAVLGPGQSVAALNRFGAVEIHYVAPTKREYRWDGASRVVKMIARQEPFRGVLGLYEPADAFGNWGNVRLVVQESNIYLPNYEEVYKFLYRSSEVMDWVYTSDGLVVGYSRTPARNQVNIELWQLYVGGVKPSSLRGARNDKIRRVGPGDARGEQGRAS